MPRLTAPQRSALADWWSLALQAGFGNYTATDVITAAADLARQVGRAFSFGEGSAIAALFGYARRMSNASAELRNAAREDYILPQHIAVPPWARDERAQIASPIWHVSYEFTYLDAFGNTQTDYKTSIFELQLPPTVGALEDAITEDAQALASKYQVAFVGVNLHQILAV